MLLGHAGNQRNRIGRFAAALLVTSIAASGTGPANAEVGDTVAPVVVDAWVSHPYVDVVDGPVDVTVRLRVQDDNSGVAPSSVILDAQNFQGPDPIPAKGMTLISGDQLDGMYEVSITFPEYIHSGDWIFTAYPADKAGNRAEQTSAGVGLFPKVISLTDKDGPEVVGSSLSSSLVDVTDGPAEVHVSLDAADEGIGMGVDDYITLASHRVSPTRSTPHYNSSGGLAEANFETTMIFSQYDASYDQRGPHTVTFSDLSDRNGNRSGASSYIGSVMVATRPLRGKRPTLTAREGILAASWDANADILGVLEYEAEFTVDGEQFAVQTKRTEAVLENPPGGSYSARVRARNQLGWGDWTSASEATNFLQSVTPAAVTFNDEDGAVSDSFTVPETKGVEYLVGDKVTAAGTYPASGTVTVKARAATYYVLAAGAAAEWSHDFKATPYPVTPAAVTFTDEDGTAEDTYTVPATEGVEYLVGDKVTAAGTYPGSGTVTVKARAATDYVLAAGAAAEWSHTFRATPYQVTPAAVAFSDQDGTAEDTFTVPVTDGVEYLVGDKVTAAGTYPGSGTVTVKARAATDYVLAAGATAEWSHAFSAKFPAVPGSMVPVTPFRALDTRKSASVGPDGTVSFQVAGVGGVPSGVSAVVFNMTVAEAKAYGFVTAYASGTTRPDASNLNFDKGQIVANSVTVPVGADGKVTLFNRSAGATHLLADVSGYYLPGTPTAAGAFASMAPTRFLDTRNGAAVGPDSTVSFQVAGANGIPAGVSAVVMNLTVADAKSFGFITAYPSGTARPNASNVNFDKGQIIPNAVTVPVGADGKVTLFNRSGSATHLLADVSGYYLNGTPTAAGTFKAVSPARFLDTRTSAPVRADGSVSFQVGGAKGIPADAAAVVFNLTVADAASFGFITAHASGTARPDVSNVNFDAGQIVPNLVTVPVGSDGRVNLFNRSSGPTQLLADVSGYFLAG